MLRARLSWYQNLAEAAREIAAGWGKYGTSSHDVAQRKLGIAHLESVVGWRVVGG